MSNTLGILTLAKALKGAEEYTGYDETGWHAVNQTQKTMLGWLGKVRSALDQIPTLKGWARNNAEELNQILAEHGFEIRLQPRPSTPDTFGVVAINDFTVNWKVVGETRVHGDQLLIGGRPAFRLEFDQDVRILESGQHRQPIIRITTKSGDMVYMTRHNQPLEGFDLIETASLIRSKPLYHSYLGFKGVDIPMVNFRLQPDISWLLDLELEDYWITQALQEVVFGMNHTGARVKEATAVALTRGDVPRYYKMDGPFLMWIERVGISAPLFTAWITPEDWKDPGDLAAL